MTTRLFDCAKLWDSLPAETQREIGKAAILNSVAAIGQEAALAVGDMRRGRFYDIADGVSLAAILTPAEAAIALVVDADGELPLPNLAPFGVQQCQGCGCIDGVACPEGCGWAREDLCTACAEMAADLAEEQAA